MAKLWDIKAAAFHAANPHVYERLKELALATKNSGRSKYGIKVLYNVLRWEEDLATEDDTPYKLNDAYHAWYARQLMANEPELKGFFHTRNRG